MKEQIVSFKTAKLAKEVGFITKTSERYIHRHKEHEEEDYIGELTSNPLNCDIPAPTQSLLQKWLREVFKVIVNVTPIDDWDCWGYTLLGEDVMQPFRRLDLQYNEYPTYEEALEAGLLEALKILKEEEK